MTVFVQFALVAAIVAPSFVLFVVHVLVNLRQVNAKWSKNWEYRKKRKAGNNRRIFFNPKGQVVTEELVQAHQLEAFERVCSSLSNLANGHAFGNATLYKIHGSVKLAQEVAERCKQGVCNFLSLKKADPKLLSGVADVEVLLQELLERRDLSSDPAKVLNAFKEQLAVVHAACSGSQTASGSWTYKGDAKKGVEEALLGTDQVGKKATSVPDFPSNPIPELTKRATKLIKSPWTKEKNTEGPPRPHFVEPLDMAEQVHVRAGGLLFWFSELRDKYSIGSNRLMAALILSVLAAGPVRFIGPVAAIAFAVVLAVEVLLDVARANEKGDFGGFVKAMKGSAHRIVVPVALGAVVAFALFTGRLSTPSTVGELEAKGTFLPLPPHYVDGLKDLPGRRFGGIPIEGFRGLATFLGENAHVAIIYGIMHGNLWLLCLLPLPVCYGLQAEFVERYPKLRWCVPQNPVWLHRMLGYLLLGGLLTTAVFWLVVQGLNCFVSQLSNPQVCDAFEPLAAIGKDVFVLRFHIVWPLMFCFIPLMAFDKHPEEASHSPAPSKGPAAGGPESASRDERGPLLAGGGPAQGAAKEDVEGGAAAKAELLAKRPEEEEEKPTLMQKVLRFLHRRLVEVCMVSIAGAGSILAVQQSGSSAFVPFFVPLWPLVLFVVLIQILAKFRSMVAGLLGSRLGGLEGHGDEWFQMLRRSWWEIAYCSHTIGFLVVVAFALLIRIQVFWPALLTWGLYFFDRWRGIRAAARNMTQIVIGEGKSSYVVNSTENGEVKPSCVRLVLKRPEGFKYRAGQWVHLALPQCGAHFGAPPWLSPMLHWHAFSIASTENEEELEFHIAVSRSSKALVEDGMPLTVSGSSEHFIRISRQGHWLDWLRPHVVPLFGAKPDISTWGSSHKAQTSGIFVHLEGPDGQRVTTVQPQLQWTGRLWNTVNWLLQLPERERKTDAPAELVKIMGPYGTLPYTCEAHQAVMLIGAGVGFPSTGSMLRKILDDNAALPAEERRAVCFMWTATKVDQLLLCFPSLLVDLARYVSKKSIEDLKSWLTIKIFVSSFDAGDFLSVNPEKHLSPAGGNSEASLRSVREWLLGSDGDSHDEDGTYICQGSLGASFGDVLRCSLFTKEHLIRRQRSLGVCFCGPQDLCSWIRSEQANTLLPVKVQFHSECAG